MLRSEQWLTEQRLAWSAGGLDALAPELARLLRWTPRLMRGICVDCRAILTAVILVVRSRGK